MEWLLNISPETIVIVPTRGLQHSLSKRYAELQISAGRTAWQTPKIIVWEDYIEQLWHKNKHMFETAYIRLDKTQAFLIWQQIISKEKKNTAELLLLNEQQTAKVVQRSWQLANKWQVEIQALQQKSDIDSAAFVSWCHAYQTKLKEKNWIDPSQIEHLLIANTSTLRGLPEKLVFAYFDLMTSSQRMHIDICKNHDINIAQYSVFETSSTKNQQIVYQRYQQEDQEWRTVMIKARRLIEQNQDARISIVIPALAEQRARVEQVARSIFYPGLSPLECQQQDLVYRFSLGQPLNSIPYIHCMLNALELLKKTFSYQNLHTLFISQWWPLGRQKKHASDNSFGKSFEHNFDKNLVLQDLVQLDRAIKKSRNPWLNWQEVQKICIEKLPEAHYLNDFFTSLIEFQESIFTQEKNLQSARQWQGLFSEWLILLQWPENELDSWHFQAHESWLETMQTFVGHDLVQGKTGLTRALLTLNGLCKDTVFMRQAKHEPILISGVLEGIGQTADYLFITGMHEGYPTPMRPDPFIDNSALEEQQYPFANKRDEFVYEQNKLSSLLAGGQIVEVSYATQQLEGEYDVTSLLREHEFSTVEDSLDQNENASSLLIEYTDLIGLECLQSANIQGGSKVFENQSQCPFKAYVEHRLLRQTEEEPEFGLDARDAGTVVHDLLDNIWRELQSFSILNSLVEADLEALIERHVNGYIDTPNPKFQYDRQRLLILEKPRLKNLLKEWLMLEQEQRHVPYNVIGVEKTIQSEFGGIPIRLVIDRIDRTDSGDCLIIDYKTGQAEISEWNGERPKNPQMPLYALALEQASDYNIAGIAFGKLKKDDCGFKGVTKLEGIGDGFRPSISSRIKDRKTWDVQLQEWHENLSNLAEEFLAGEAVVNPSKAKPCQFCDLHSVCRIHQLESQSGQDSNIKSVSGN